MNDDLITLNEEMNKYYECGLLAQKNVSIVNEQIEILDKNIETLENQRKILKERSLKYKWSKEDCKKSRTIILKHLTVNMLLIAAYVILLNKCNTPMIKISNAFMILLIATMDIRYKYIGMNIITIIEYISKKPSYNHDDLLAAIEKKDEELEVSKNEMDKLCELRELYNYSSEYLNAFQKNLTNLINTEENNDYNLTFVDDSQKNEHDADKSMPMKHTLR